MAYYKIIETPGRREVDVEKELGEKVVLNSQDIANTVVQRLRAKAKKKAKKVDYVAVRDTERSKAASGNVSSIRLGEVTRKRLAKFVGRYMWEHGESISMGEAVDYLIDELEKAEGRVAELESDDEDDDE